MIRAIAVRNVNMPSLRAQRIIEAVSRRRTLPHSVTVHNRAQPTAGNHHEGEQMATADLAEQHLLINGEWRAARSGNAFSRPNPYTGETATSASAGGREDASAAVDAAQAAFLAWSQTGPGERRAILSRAADLITERQNEIAQTMIEETGATFGWGMFNCMLASGMLREAAAQTYGTLGEVIPSDVPGKLAMAVRAPAGVVIGIAPWNAPVILAVRAVAMPLAFGNTVVLKASELCPRTHAHVAAAIADAGVPPGVINFLTNAPDDAAEVVEELIAHPDTRRVNFTGSTRVGRIIAELAGRHLKRTVLELGGKAPLIVLADADLERAAAATSFGAFFHQGQICMSTERIVVDRSVAEPFAQLLAARASALRVGDPRDAETQIGPLINDAALTRVSELVEDARERGAQVLAGGAADGPCYPPTVLLGVSSEMRVYGEESFGPLASIIPVDGVEHAVAVANDTDYGLAAAVFSADVAQALEVARRVQSGICHINDATVHDEPQMPFGGVKDSGWGRFGGRAALEEFTELRWITIQETERHYPI
jgi:benzaldehyde dehydrogenase (NAD)